MLIIASNDNIGEPGVAQIDGAQRLTVNWENPPGEIENAEFSALASLIISAAMQGPKTGAPSLPRLIGLTGVMGSGKSTVAALLGMVGYRELNFAKALRDEVHAVAVWEPDDDEYGDEYNAWAEFLQYTGIQGLKAAWQEVRVDPVAIWRKPTSPAVRLVLQTYGTDHIRARNEDHWVQELAFSLSAVKLTVIGDVRFANEAAWIKAQGGVVWEVRRGVKPPATHASEELNYPVDAFVDNSAELRGTAAWLRSMLYEVEEKCNGPVD